MTAMGERRGMTDIVDRLRRMAMAVFLATEKGPATDISKGLCDAADEIDRLRKEVERLGNAGIELACVVYDEHASHRMLAEAEAREWKDCASRAEAKVEDLTRALRKARVAVVTWSPNPTEPLEEIDAALARSEIEPGRPAADAPKENRNG